MLKRVVLAVGLIAIPSIASAQQQQCQLECTRVTGKGERMLVIVQIWDAQNQEVTRRVRATSRRIASKVVEELHAGKTAKIVPKADATPS